MNEKLAAIGYELRGFIQTGPHEYIVMAEGIGRTDNHRWGTALWRSQHNTVVDRHLHLTFEQARDDMADRAGYVRGEQAMVDGIRVEQMRVDDAARVRPGRRG